MNADLLSYKVSEIEVIYRHKCKLSEKPKIRSSQEVYELLRSLWSDKLDYCEQFYILLLNRGNVVLGVSLISEGGVSGTVVDPKKIFQAALMANASNLILAHNHPSGTLKPSEADLNITKKICNAGQFLEITVLDHLIVTSEGFFSFADEGQL